MTHRNEADDGSELGVLAERGCWLNSSSLIVDCLFHIFSFLGPTELGRLASTCRELRKMADVDTLWNPLTVNHFGKDLGSFPARYVYEGTNSVHWKIVYRELGINDIEIEFRSGPRQNDNTVITPKGATVGRSRSNNVCILHDEMVSRRHARISWRARRYWIHDVGGINGTSVNGQSLPQHVDCLLRFGDEVDLGASSFVIRVHALTDDSERCLTARQQQQQQQQQQNA